MSTQQIASVVDLDGTRIGLRIKKENAGYSIQTIEGIEVTQAFRYPSEEDAMADLGCLFHDEMWGLQWEIQPK